RIHRAAAMLESEAGRVGGRQARCIDPQQAVAFRAVSGHRGMHAFRHHRAKVTGMESGMGQLTETERAAWTRCEQDRQSVSPDDGGRPLIIMRAATMTDFVLPEATVGQSQHMKRAVDWIGRSIN